jgi:hypothetical protein
VTHNGADATLLVNQPDTTWRCNDDSHGTLMPAIDFANPSGGQYDVWVGTYDASSHNPATFYITELASNNPGVHLGTATPPPTPPPYVPPTPPTGVTGLSTAALAGNSTPVTLAPGFMPDPHTVIGTSGGEVMASSLGITASNGGYCTGYISANPDHIFTSSGSFPYLRIDAVGANSGDTTMVILDPTGQYRCDDDGGGYPNPRIAGAFPPGTYRVWVGSYGSGEFHQYSLSFTEAQP